MGSPLLERDRELLEIAQAVGEVADGSGRILLVEGPAGIGKTAVLAAARLRAEADGLVTLSARGGELERDFAHGVVRQLYEPVVRDAEPARRRRLFGGPAALAVPVLDLAGELPDGDRARGDDATFATNHGLYWFTAALAEERPLALLVDDAHWADPPSLLFMHYLARRLEGLPVAVVLAFRSGEPGMPGDLLQSLRSLPPARSLHPSALSDAGTAALIERVTGRSPEPAFREACHETTGGNPFFLQELLRELAGQDVQPVAAHAGRVRHLGPGTIADRVLGRLATLWPEAVELARAVALLDTDAELRHAAMIAGLDPRAAAVAADALTGAYVLAPGEALRLAHPVIRQAVYADIPARRREADHARAGRILDADGRDPDRAAVHLQAGCPAGDAWVAERLHQAGRRALARGAPDAAAALLERCLREPPAARERAAVLLDLGRAAQLAGRDEALPFLRRALEECRDAAMCAAAARELAQALSLRGMAEEAVEVLEATVRALPEARADERALLEAELLAISVVDEQLARRAGGRIDELLAGVRSDRPAQRVLLAAAAYHRLQTGSATAAEVARLSERALAGRLLVEEHDAGSLVPAQAIGGLLFTDRFDEAGALLDVVVEKAQATGSLTGLGVASALRARLELFRGRLREAEALAEEALRATSGALAELALYYLALALIEQGRVGDAARALAGSDEHGPPTETTFGHMILVARGVVALEERRVEDARALAQAALRRIEERGGDLPGRGFRVSLAHPLRVAGEHERARAVARADVERARAFGLPGPLGSALAALAVTEGCSPSVPLLHEAERLLRGSPRRLEHAHALVELGAALRRDNQRSDSRAPLGEGMELALRCGATPLIERAEQELRALGARPRRQVLSGVDSLTASEHRVARMAAEGRSNPEIAQGLFITRKTVETHLGQVYRKLDIHSRAELGAALGGEPPEARESVTTSVRAR